MTAYCKSSLLTGVAGLRPARDTNHTAVTGYDGYLGSIEVLMS